ncbi:MAG: response regulator [Anaerolineae bacterium]|nr:response regulator [Anaerolineae bacterium]
MARILVIDDNADLLQMIRMLLEDRGGHTVVLSAEGEDGLAKAMANPPDLAIVDVMMPGMTGYEVCRRLRKEPATANMPIIILTARGQSVDREAALEAGANEHMAKPVTMSELLDRVNDLLATSPQPPTAPSAVQGIVGVLSLRGGVGVTTVAVNLAVLFARRIPGRVCLVDLSPSSGHVALHLGLRPDPNWLPLGALSPGAIDAAINNYLMGHAAGLAVLAAPYVPVIGTGLSRETVAATLNALKKHVGVVVVDLPSVLTEGAAAVVEAADAIVLVTTADPAALQTTLGSLQALKAWSSKIHLALNQIVPGAAPPAEALQRVVKHPFAATVPYESAQVQVVSQGKPLALIAPQSPLVQGIARLAAGLGLVP